jgi:regulator of sigma D
VNENADLVCDFMSIWLYFAVSKKVEAKGRTTYNEVADEIFAELKSITQNGLEFDEKNIRRRVYDAFNVLIAIRVIAKDKKEIKWMGLTNYRYEKIQKLEEVHKELITRIKNKKKLLQEIEKQFDDLQNITLRNQASQRPAESVNGILLPFLLIKVVVLAW